MHTQVSLGEETQIPGSPTADNVALWEEFIGDSWEDGWAMDVRPALSSSHTNRNPGDDSEGGASVCESDNAH